MEGLGRNPGPFRYAQIMDSQTSQMLINVFGMLIGLVILQIILKQWDKRAKAKEAAAQKTAVTKKKK